MRSRALLVAGAAVALTACNLTLDPNGVKFQRFHGGVGAAWETVANGPWSCCPGFSDYTPRGQSGFYAAEYTALGQFDPSVVPSGAWKTLAAAPASLIWWPGSAWVGNALFFMENDAVYRYDITADSWTTPLSSTLGATAYAQLTHDDQGRVYAVESNAPYRVIQYDPATNGVQRLPTGGFNLYVYEPRITWDPITKRLFIGVGYDSPELWSFDPSAPGTAQRLADVPAVGGGSGTGMGDPFCGDRSGHIYAIGDNGCNGSNSVFQYDTLKNTWSRIPDLPGDHGCDGACTVTDDGWLYLAPGDTTPPQTSGQTYRIRLF